MDRDDEWRDPENEYRKVLRELYKDINEGHELYALLIEEEKEAIYWFAFVQKSEEERRFFLSPQKREAISWFGHEQDLTKWKSEMASDQRTCNARG